MQDGSGVNEGITQGPGRGGCFWQAISEFKENTMQICKAILAGVMVMCLCTAAQAAVADRIAAVVNDEVITLSELNRLLEPYKARLEGAPPGPEREKALDEVRVNLLNRMIDELLMEQQARKTGITIRNDEVTATVTDLIRRKNLSEDEFRKALERAGGTMEGYRKDVRDQLIRIRLIQREIKAKIAVSDEEIGEYYRKHREDYEGNEAVRIRQILLLLPKNDTSNAKVTLQAQAMEIHKRLQAGEPFAQLTAQYSQGPAADEGGDIGFIEKGVILPEVEAAAFALPINQVSPVIESPVGFHIIQVIDRRGAGLKAIESVREEIRAKIEQDKMEKKFEEWVVNLRKKSHIEIRP
jgi:peptidyl-prolyl cis-trans isomerase SurA